MDHNVFIAIVLALLNLLGTAVAYANNGKTETIVRQMSLVIDAEGRLMYDRQEVEEWVRECGTVPIGAIPYLPEDTKDAAKKAALALHQSYTLVRAMGGQNTLSEEGALLAMGDFMPTNRGEVAHAELTCSVPLERIKPPQQRPTPDSTVKATTRTGTVTRSREWIDLLFVVGTGMWYTPDGNGSDGLVPIFGIGTDVHPFTPLTIGAIAEGGRSSDRERTWWAGGRIHAMWSLWPPVHAGLYGEWQRGWNENGQSYRGRTAWGIRAIVYLFVDLSSLPLHDRLALEILVNDGRETWAGEIVSGGRLTEGKYGSMGWRGSILLRW